MERAIPILPTEDLKTAKAFYVTGLGFRVTFEASEDGRSEDARDGRSEAHCTNSHAAIASSLMR